jgi:hypothetical protein
MGGGGGISCQYPPPPQIHGGINTERIPTLNICMGSKSLEMLGVPQRNPLRAQINDFYRALTELVQNSAYRGANVGLISLVIIQSWNF